MTQDQISLKLIAFEAVFSHGYALPLFAQSEQANVLYAAECYPPGDHSGVISHFFVYESNSFRWLPASLQRNATQGGPWLDVFLRDDPIAVGSPNELWSSLTPVVLELSAEAPLSLFDAAMCVGVKEGLNFCNLAHKHVVKRFGARRGGEWINSIIEKMAITYIYSLLFKKNGNLISITSDVAIISVQHKRGSIVLDIDIDLDSYDEIKDSIEYLARDVRKISNCLGYLLIHNIRKISRDPDYYFDSGDSFTFDKIENATISEEYHNFEDEFRVYFDQAISDDRFSVDIDLINSLRLAIFYIKDSSQNFRRGLYRKYLGCFLLRTNELDEALMVLRAALHDLYDDPIYIDTAQTLQLIANTLTKMGIRDRDEALLTEAVSIIRPLVSNDGRLNVDLANAISARADLIESRDLFKEAVKSYKAALTVLSPDQDPLLWGQVENNLGIALTKLGQRETGTVCLMEAIEACNLALGARPRKGMPLEWAATQYNLGNALLAVGERTGKSAQLTQAIDAYRLALEEWTRERVPLDWAATQNGLGNAHLSLGEITAKLIHLEQAIDAYRQALEERTRERVPLDWAGTQTGLGNALLSLGEHTGILAHAEQAIDAYRLALEEKTRERVPADWAAIHFSLGKVLLFAGKKTANKEYLDQAIDVLRQSLDDGMPSQWRPNMYVRQQLLDSALSSLAALTAK